MKNASQWKPDVLLVLPDRRRFIVSDWYLAARVPSLDPWGLPGVGAYRKGKRGAPYAAHKKPTGAVPAVKAKHLEEMAAASETEAWPLAGEMGFPDEHELFMLSSEVDHIWLWSNENGDVLGFNAQFFDDLSVLTGLDSEREYRFTCESPRDPLFVWEYQRRRDVWLGALMPMRISGGLVQAAELPNGTEGRGKAA